MSQIGISKWDLDESKFSGSMFPKFCFRYVDDGRYLAGAGTKSVSGGIWGPKPLQIPSV